MSVDPYHLAVGLRGLPPKDYHESFIGLARLGILSHEEATELAQVAGLRNRLAHEYNGIDDALVHACASRCLTDVPAYLRAIEAFLEGSEAE